MNEQLLPPFIQQLASYDKTCVWIADENAITHISQLAAYKKHLRLLTNRYDVHQQALDHGIQSNFSDFDFSIYKDDNIAAFFYRIAKEKPINQHILQQVNQYLVSGGQLLITGEKNEGIKTIFKQASDIFSIEKPLKKESSAYWGILNKTNNIQVDDQSNYHQLVNITEINGLAVKSKPGVFGWQKVDLGSQLLIEQLILFYKTYQPSFQSMLDLGCGYGYLTLASIDLGFKEITATDNNAAAITCTKENAKNFGIEVDVIADDCGANIQKKYDLILCNPPFHQGFSISSDLTHKFLQSAQRLLKPKGQAFFVVNSFIPIEKKASNYFKKTELLYNDKQFKVLNLS